ncbi:MAG: HDIG domain-containing protein [Chloroflexi bacterium]|nr:HDIG domain-containing protein [Chloroflexota bacterium]
MRKKKKLSRWQQFIRGSRLWFFAVGLTASLTLILSFNLVTPSDVSVTVGERVTNEILAPRTISYTSDVLTEGAKDLAAQNIPDVYTQIDPEIGRGQLNLAQSIFSFIDVVRSDTQATNETKLTYLQEIEALTLEEEVGEEILSMTESDYAVAKNEVTRIIGEIMRQDIKESQVQEFTRRASREARLDLTPTQSSFVTTLAPQFIVPTIFYDSEVTDQLRAEAITAVEPSIRTIYKDERILRAGDEVRNEDVEALVQLGLLEQDTDWRDVTSVLMLSILSVVVLTLHWQQFHQKHWAENSRYLLALFGIIVVFVLLAKVLVASAAEFAYWYPIAAMSMLLTVIYDARLSILATMIMAVIYGYIAPNSLELTLYAATGGILASLTLHDAQRINSFFRSGLVAGVGYSVVVVLFRLTLDVIDVVPLLQLLLFGFANGILSAALTLVGFFVLGSLFGVTTTLQLQELSRLDHPLLQELLRRAPGTYHHSIMVANLAEQAAEEIRANSGLIRVGAFYHDIGKMNRPPFFTENQEGVNPHDSLDPFTSGRIILSHVTDGLELARKYKLPDRIRDFIAEHHGMRIVKGFYFKAREQAGDDADGVDKELFRYPGPRPRSRETGIVLMADAIESTSRALQPDTPHAIEKLVNSLIDEDIMGGQLDDSGLTMGDISLIRASFIKTLKGRFHVRVKYPGNDELMAEMNQQSTTPSRNTNVDALATVPAATAPSGSQDSS